MKVQKGIMSFMKRLGKPSANTGFTLIEVMISLLIMTLLITTAQLSYSMFATRWKNELGNFYAELDTFKSLSFLQKMLDGIHPFVVKNDSNLPVFLFVGGNKSLYGVNRNGFSNHWEVFRLTAVKKDDKFQLIYQYKAMSDFSMVKTSQEIVFEDERVILENVDEMSVEYFGWQHIYIKTGDMKESGPQKPVWTSTYSGLDSRYMPNTIRLRIQINGQIVELNSLMQNSFEDYLTVYNDDAE